MNSPCTYHSSPSSKTTIPCEAVAVTHPNVLTCNYQDSSYGVSFIPWDERIRLQEAQPGMNSLQHIIGTIALSDCIVPVFDLRPESNRMKGDNEITAYLLTVSMLSNTTGPMAVGLVVELVNGQVNIAANSIQNRGLLN